jgi:hypothetical protein
MVRDFKSDGGESEAGGGAFGGGDRRPDVPLYPKSIYSTGLPGEARPRGPRVVSSKKSAESTTTEPSQAASENGPEKVDISALPPVVQAHFREVTNPGVIENLLRDAERVEALARDLRLIHDAMEALGSSDGSSDGLDWSALRAAATRILREARQQSASANVENRRPADDQFSAVEHSVACLEPPRAEAELNEFLGAVARIGVATIAGALIGSPLGAWVVHDAVVNEMVKTTVVTFITQSAMELLQFGRHQPHFVDRVREHEERDAVVDRSDDLDIIEPPRSDVGSHRHSSRAIIDDDLDITEPPRSDVGSRRHSSGAIIDDDLDITEPPRSDVGSRRHSSGAIIDDDLDITEPPRSDVGSPRDTGKSAIDRPHQPDAHLARSPDDDIYRGPDIGLRGSSCPNFACG